VLTCQNKAGTVRTTNCGGDGVHETVSLQPTMVATDWPVGVVLPALVVGDGLCRGMQA
jgi:hypothetical protein